MRTYWESSPFFTVSAVVEGPTGPADSILPPPLGSYVNTSPIVLVLEKLLSDELLPPEFEFVLEANAMGGGGGDDSCAGAAAVAVCKQRLLHVRPGG